MPLVDKYLVCTCGRPTPIRVVHRGDVCQVCGRDLFKYLWEESERELLTPKGRGRPPKRRL